MLLPAEIQRLKAAVVSTIRHQKELEVNLNLMDIKIGLLVKNRLDLDDVVRQNAKLYRKTNAFFAAGSKGLKTLSKENRERLEVSVKIHVARPFSPVFLCVRGWMPVSGKHSHCVFEVHNILSSICLTVYLTIS